MWSLALLSGLLLAPGSGAVNLGRQADAELGAEREESRGAAAWTSAGRVAGDGAAPAGEPSAARTSPAPPPSAASLHRKEVTAVDLQPQGAHFLQSRSGPRRAFSPGELLDGDAGQLDCEKLVRELQRDGYTVLRNALPKTVIDGALTGMSRILDRYAGALQNQSMINSSYSDLPLDQRALAIFQEHPEVVPKFFRAELHQKEFYDLFTHRIVRRVAECVLKTRTLVLYPVYMGRMNMPNMKQHENGFHQDAYYTYEYFNANASAESIERFMTSKVNFWAPLKDVDRESGTLMVRRGYENRVGRYNEWAHNIYGYNVTELVTDLSELPLDTIVLLDDLKAGDLVVFAHQTPHRGTPNRAKDRVRWSLDWRLQNGQFSTMRDESGYLIQSDSWDAANLVTRERWTSVKPALRWSERKTAKSQGYLIQSDILGDANLLTRERPRWSERTTGTSTSASQSSSSAGTRMELDGFHTATAPGSCLRAVSAKGQRSNAELAACQQWRDHP